MIFTMLSLEQSDVFALTKLLMHSFCRRKILKGWHTSEANNRFSLHDVFAIDIYGQI